MKLVDILARELKEWPSTYAGNATDALAQDACGDLNSLRDGRAANFGEMIGSIWPGSDWTLNGITLVQAEDYKTAIVTRAQWQAAVDALKSGEQEAQPIDWSKAPEGATHWDPVDRNHLRQLGEIAQSWNEPEQSWTCKGWQYPDDLSTMPRLIKRPVWSGEGLPPVGTVCEYQTWINHEWKQTKVLAHHLGFAVHSWSVDGDDAEVDLAPPQDFRPIRTAEQIVAEERKAQIAELKDLIVRSWESASVHGMAMDIYQAGYRKVQP